jgi:hypothetical protein
LGSGAEAIYNPEMLFDLLLVQLNEGNGKEVKPFMDEYIMAHRQREDALGARATKLPRFFAVGKTGRGPKKVGGTRPAAAVSRNSNRP